MLWLYPYQNHFTNYRYGFQGQEHDKEVLDYHYRYTGFDSIQDTTTLTTLFFSGTNTGIDAGNDARSLTNELTISAWIRTSDNTSGSTMIAHDYRSSEAGYKLLLANGRVKLTGKAQQNGVVRSSGRSQIISDGLWHFVTGVITADDEWQIYVDGFMANAGTYTPSTNDLTNTRSLFIGKSNNSNNNFIGDIRDVAIWNVAKDANEVLVDFTQEHPQGTEPNLVGFYPLDEGNGTTATDLSASANNGTITNEDWSTYETYKMVIKPYYDTTVSNYLSFDGTDDVINAGTDNRGVTTDLTLEAWVRTTSSSGLQTLASKYDNNGAKGYKLCLNGSNLLLLVGNGTGFGGTRTVNSTSPINDGNWHHVTATISSSNEYKIYIDGNLDNTSNFASGSYDISNSSATQIGVYNNFGYFKGDMQEVSIWNRAKTDIEVFYDFMRTNPTGNEAGLVGYFPLNEGSGSVATDLSVSGLNGNVLGATWDSEVLLDSSYLAMDSTRLENRNSVNYKYRMSDSRLGRFFAVDPLYAKYPWNSNYAFSENTVIDHVELEGLEKAKYRRRIKTKRNFSGVGFIGRLFGMQGRGKYLKNNLWGSRHKAKGNGNQQVPSAPRVPATMVTIPPSLPPVGNTPLAPAPAIPIQNQPRAPIQMTTTGPPTLVAPNNIPNIAMPPVPAPVIQPVQQPVPQRFNINGNFVPITRTTTPAQNAQFTNQNRVNNQLRNIARQFLAGQNNSVVISISTPLNNNWNQMTGNGATVGQNIMNRGNAIRRVLRANGVPASAFANPNWLQVNWNQRMGAVPVRVQTR